MLDRLLSRRHLIAQLVIRDLKMRYSQPILGFLWAFLSPLCTAFIFYFIFSSVLNVEIKEAPFLLYLMSGVFSWSFFQESVSAAVTSLVQGKNLVKEGRLPHYLIPLSIVLANLINFLASLTILFLSSFIILKGLPLAALFFPIVLLTQLCITVALGIIFSILYVNWRDIKYIVDALLLFILYLTPAFYSLYQIKSVAPGWLFKIYIFNPFVGVLTLYRLCLFRGYWGLLEKDFGIIGILTSPVLFAALLLSLAIWFYQRHKRNINDYLSY